jgi:acyl-coenzyme A thioesterase PaaI-like protein
MLAKTAQLWAFGVLKAPLIFFLRPRMVELSPERAALKLRLSRRTKNQGGSMYFGALMSGADMVPGILATAIGHRLHREVSFAVKDCQARFLRRAGGDVTFVCEDAGEIERAIITSVETSARQSVPVKVAATVGLERVADFALTFSLKAA